MNRNISLDFYTDSQLVQLCFDEMGRLIITAQNDYEDVPYFSVILNNEVDSVFCKGLAVKLFSLGNYLEQQEDSQNGQSTVS